MMSRLRRQPAMAATGLVLLFILLAWAQSFFTDDAFISLRYAENLVRGHGLVWNPGEPPVEGYTNFLWVLVMAIPTLTGLNALFFSLSLGLILLGTALAVQYKLAVRVTGKPWAGTTAVLLLGGFHTFRAFASGGLETMLQSVLVLIIMWLAVEVSWGGETRPGTLAAVSILLGMSFLTRMDSILLGGIPVAWLALMVIRKEPRKKVAGRLSALFGPFILIFGSWFFWKLAYYGSILPNTFYVKVPGWEFCTAGLSYLHYFFSSYFLYPFAAAVIFSLFNGRRRAPAGIWVMSLVCITWMAYLVRIGGDFMEFRLLVPILPFLSLLFLWAALDITPSPVIRGLAVLLLLVGSAHHQVAYKAVFGTFLPESTHQLQMHLTDEGDGWITSGRRLGQYLGDAPGEPVTIAVTAAGAIPYFSGLRTIDMLGLSDPWIAKNGLLAPTNVMGHQRVAPVQYLMERGVHLLLGHPRTFPNSVNPSQYLDKAILLLTFNQQENLDQLAPVVRIVEIPVSDSRNLPAIYLRNHESIENLIKTGVFRSYRVNIGMGKGEE